MRINWISMVVVGSAAVSAFAGDAVDAPYNRADWMKKYLPISVPYPKDNAPTADRERLGRTLFFDPRLSGSAWISCATCHNPGLAWGDGLAKGLGHMGTHLGRHTPTILNVAYGEPYFWDGRAATLEDQAKGPLTSSKEMSMSVESA